MCDKFHADRAIATKLLRYVCDTKRADLALHLRSDEMEVRLSVKG